MRMTNRDSDGFQSEYDLNIKRMDVVERARRILGAHESREMCFALTESIRDVVSIKHSLDSFVRPAYKIADSTYKANEWPQWATTRMYVCALPAG